MLHLLFNFLKASSLLPQGLCTYGPYIGPSATTFLISNVCQTSTEKQNLCIVAMSVGATKLKIYKAGQLARTL